MDAYYRDTIAVDSKYVERIEKIDRSLIDIERIQRENKNSLDVQQSNLAKKCKQWESIERILLSGDYWCYKPKIIECIDRNTKVQVDNLLTHLMAIQEAITGNDFLSFKYLVDNEKFVGCKDDHGRTPLHLAVLYNRKAMVNHLISLYPWSVNLVDKEGQSVLYYAIHLPQASQRCSLVRLLKEAGANENACDIVCNYDPYVSEANEVEISITSQNMTSVQTFINDDTEPIEPEIENLVLELNFGSKIFRELEEILFQNKLEQICRIAEKHASNVKLLGHLNNFIVLQNRLNEANDAIETADNDKLRDLIDRDLIVARNYRGFCLLHEAVLSANYQITEYIASEFPKYVDVIDIHGRTALYYSAKTNDELFKCLVQCGARISITEDKNRARIQDTTQNITSIMNQERILRNVSASIETLLTIKDETLVEKIDCWLNDGDVANLEKLVISGNADHLRGKTSSNKTASRFLAKLQDYQAKISSIHEAVEEGELYRLNCLINKDILAQARDKRGMTPLHKAVIFEQTNTVRYILARHPNTVDLVDNLGRTPLHYAMTSPQKTSIVKMICKKGADDSIHDLYGRTPSFYKSHPKFISTRSLRDEVFIAQLNTGEWGQSLLQDFEDDISDWIYAGNIRKLEQLVLCGYGDLLLGRLSDIDNTDVLQFLEIVPQYQAKINATHEAVENGDLSSVKLLVDRKKMAFCRDKHRLTPLHKAILFRRTNIVKYLLQDYPQAINSFDDHRHTPLHYAAAMNDGGSMYRILRNAGADPNIIDCKEHTAKYYLNCCDELNLDNLKQSSKAALNRISRFKLASSYLETRIQQWLRQGDIARLNQLTLSGCGDMLLGRDTINSDIRSYLDALPKLLASIDAIHDAIKLGDLEKVKVVMNSKLLALARNTYGWTPLHTAIVYDKTEISRHIIERFPSVIHSHDYNKRTPMHYAAACLDGGYILKILHKAGGDTNATDIDGRTPDYYKKNSVLNLKSMREPRNLKRQYHLLDISTYDESIDCKGSVISSSSSDDLLESNFAGIASFEDFPISNSSLYLVNTVAPALKEVLSQVVVERPSDPIGFMIMKLQNYHSE